MVRLTVLLALALAAACARSTPGVVHYTQGIGNATAVETYEKTQRVLLMHQFEIEHETGPPSMYFQTRWRDRAPFEDEQRLGIEAAQVRAIVRARNRGATSFQGEFYSVDLTVEQRVRTMGSQQWIVNVPTESARAFAMAIAEDLRRELDVGVRRH